MNKKSDLYQQTKKWLQESKLECRCGFIGRINEGFIIYEDNPKNIAIYFFCSKCKRKYFSQMPGHFELTTFQVTSSPSLFFLRFLNKIFK